MIDAPDTDASHLLLWRRAVGGWAVTSHDLPWLVAFGKTRGDALREAAWRVDVEGDASASKAEARRARAELPIMVFGLIGLIAVSAAAAIGSIQIVIVLAGLVAELLSAGGGS